MCFKIAGISVCPQHKFDMPNNRQENFSKYNRVMSVIKVEFQGREKAHYKCNVQVPGYLA